jgi:hypothetical protein
MKRAEMAFTVADFHDLVRLLEERPDWRADLRRLVLTDDVLGLPAAVRDLVEAQRRSEERLAGVEQRLERVEGRLEGAEERLGRLEESHARLEEAVAKLADVQREMLSEQRNMRREQQIMRRQLDSLRGESLEGRYRQHAPAYFGKLLRRTRVLSTQELATLVDDALDAGALSRLERDDVLDVDLVARGQRWEDGKNILLAVEVSVAIDAGDVERVVRRAAVLGKIQDAMPVVAGERLTPAGRSLAESYGVVVALDGRVGKPGDSGETAASSQETGSR